jgi:hypothetical protein
MRTAEEALAETRVKSRYFVLAVGVTACGFALWHYSQVPPAPTILSFRIGQPFQEVAKASTYPVLERSNTPTHAYLQSGETFVTEPAVILHFNDPQHQFTLPPTKFALVGYTHNKVETVSTSPMLDKLPFDRAVALLENLQNQFRAGGWVPWPGDDSTWFDLTPEGKKKLYARMFESGWAETQTLRVVGKYSMTFRLWCADGCATREPPYLFLIDVGVGEDFYERWDEQRKPEAEVSSCRRFTECHRLNRKSSSPSVRSVR